VRTDAKLHQIWSPAFGASRETWILLQELERGPDGLNVFGGALLAEIVETVGPDLLNVLPRPRA
jgi:hypothetical protein